MLATTMYRMAAGTLRGYRLGNLRQHIKVTAFVLLLQLVAVVPTAAVSYEQFEVTSGPDDDLLPLQRMVLDKSTESIYVGSVNRLYKLSSSLQVEMENITGPVDDNQNCRPPPRDTCPEEVLTNNINKVLVVNEERDQLIACGSVYQGICQILRLSDMSVIEQPRREVGTNTEEGTNVAFIAPGPSGSGKMLYTAASRAKWVRTVHTVAKLDLDSTFDLIAKKGIPQNTLDETPAGNNFDINYMFGFSSGKFSYFIATQLEDFRVGGTPLYTKIVRLCQDDSSSVMRSYIELPLICRDSNGVNYNLAMSAYVSKVGSGLQSEGISQDEDVLFATFSTDSPGGSPGNKSVVCMYPVKTINQRFLERVTDCANQVTDKTDIDWLGSSTCYPSLIGLNDPEYCHQSDTNQPLGGLDPPIEAQAIYSSGSAITAIAVTPHFDATVLLLGDELGHLMKLRMQSPTEAQVYEELPIVEGSPVVQNGLMFDKDKNYVYFMTQSKINKVPIQTCETMTTCEECLSAGGNVGDPHCGWCPLLTSCTRRLDSECPGASSMTNRWIGEKSLCIKIQSVAPPSIPSDSPPTQLEIKVTSIPKLNSSLDYYYKCVFEDLGSTRIEGSMIETTGNSSVYCQSPNTTNVKLFQQGSLSVPLSIRSTETDRLIVNTTFEFYNCSAFDSCSKCVDNAFMCNWCVYENQCLGITSGCAATGVVGYREGNHERSGMAFCPRIKENGMEILIPAGETRAFSLNAAELPVESGYECVLKYENRAIITPATKKDNNTIMCSARKYNYTSSSSFVKADLDVQWNAGKFLLDNPYNVEVTLYKCAVTRTNCGQCLMLEPKFACGWCEESTVCSMQSQCNVAQKMWLSGTDLCPNPAISSFYPKSGHVLGNTNVTILGYNLGKNMSDIIGITVAGIECVIQEYREAERIVCLTGSSVDVVEGPVTVMLGKDGMATEMATAEGSFAYVMPVITSFLPPLGPMSGGTKVTLSGTDLNAGESRTISVAGVPCNLTGPVNVSTQVSCVTSRSEEGVTGKVVMTFDDLGQVTSQSNFSYAADPVISSIDRFTTILSGGLEVDVMGDHFQVIQEPKMVFRFGSDPQRIVRSNPQGIGGSNPQRTVTSNCFNVKDSIMTCKTPYFKDVVTLNNATTPPSFVLSQSDYGFILDGVEEYLAMASMLEQFTIYTDPEYSWDEEEGALKEVPYGDRQMITIQGRYVSETYQEGDVMVYIGNMECKTLMVKGNNLTCEAPDKDRGDETYEVKVKHGNLNVTLGRIKFLPQQLSLFIIIGAACGGVLVIVIILFVVCICRRMSANERRFKKMELQRDEMEMRVAQECKDAFAELQITVLTVGNDVQGSGIPFHEYRDYAARILFPYNPNHPVFREIPVSKENISGVKRDVLQKGLVQFGNLIGNQTFLTIFLHTMEAQKTLTLKDLSNIASLLVIALHNRMDFLMEAIKALLQKNILDYCNQGCPQLLLRRSEAVVEKLVSHWLSLLMYDSLRESMGKPLFHLFYAIKQQIDKGPVDSITGEARYGLSEMKVIRQQIDFQTLNISTTGFDVTAEPIQLKVLDCDTISQTKDKILDAIFKTCPFSKRPSRDELDLEWSDKPQGSMILLDEDVRGRLDGEWKRINTLAHYQVTDGATLCLVRAQPNGGSLPNSPARKYSLGTYHTLPATSATPIIDPERGSYQWHLVKHVDSGSLKKGERDQKMMAEIYLPRLLTTKGILQQFVDELLETIFKCDDSEVPLIIKYFFDFLDDQARLQEITNPDVVHGWKSNSLQLRFWVNLIKNPDILFDINKSGTVDACLSTIGQTLIDACSVSQQTLTKDSPSNKLLYAKDIPTYKEWVANYYKEINNMAAVSDQDMGAMLAAHTNRYQNEFQPLNALNELYFCYACIYKSEILQALDEDKDALKQNLGDRLEDIFRLMADSA